jgi:hypothetical protein
MDQSPLVIDEIEAGKELIKRLNACFHVIAACWLRDDSGGSRRLYIAIDGLMTPDTRMVNHEVRRIANEVKDHYIDPFWVSIIGPTDRIAKAVMEVYARFPGRKPPSRVYEYGFGGMGVEEMYIYPPLPKKPLATTNGEVIDSAEHA